MITLRGNVEGIIYNNEENGYTVFVMHADGEMITVVGSFPMLKEGEPLVVTGEYIQHQTYGEQFKAQNYQVIIPEGEKEIECYLASGIIKGIGPSLAREIVNVFGKQALEIIEKNHEQLCRVSGIGKVKARQIHESFAEAVGSQRTIMFLQKYGLSTALSLKIYNFYGDRAISVIQTNPYALVSDIEGVGFHTADKIASSIGIDADSSFRISAGVCYCLLQAGGEGNTFLPKDELLRVAQELLLCKREQLEAVFEKMAISQKIILRNYEGTTAVYLPLFFYAEAQAASRLIMLQNSIKKRVDEDVSAEIDDFERANGITLAAAQRSAVEKAINNGICVITGGPGTGKTTTLNCIISLFRRRGKEIALAAPTGRAAKRMADATGTEAKTIHRLLEYTKTDEGPVFKCNKDNPVKCGVCIIDETSMVDIFLLNALLAGLETGTRLVFAGDSDQLPSVGAGNVLADIIASKMFPVVRLNEIFRQAAQSMIIVNAHRINRGEMPLINTHGGDFFMQKCDDEQNICLTVLELCAKRLPNHYNADPLRDIQVLAPMKKGICGVINMNLQLQRVLNPPQNGTKECRHGETLFRCGDKVMQVRNNYQRAWQRTDHVGIITEGEGVFNGDSGIIFDIENNSVHVRFDDERVSVYDFPALDELMLAYAVSVHKSQGCEFKLVVIPLPVNATRIMTRNLFYTAVTRASEAVVLVGGDDAVRQMVRNNRMQTRYSALDLRLKSSCDVL